MASYIGRRKFLATIGGAAAWPLAPDCHGQQLIVALESAEREVRKIVLAGDKIT